MRNRTGRRALLVAVMLLALSPASRATDGRPPTIRIGLGAADARVVLLSARGGLRVVDADNGVAPWLDRFDGDLRVVLLGGGRARTVYRVQVGSYRSEAGALEMATRLERETGVEARVHHDPDRRVYRVRVGAFGDRIEAGGLLARMNESGFPDAWIAAEVVGDGSGASLRLVDDDYREKVVSARRLRVEAVGRGLVAVNGRRYRGYVEVFIDRSGQLRAVNIVGLEDYLRGVVPDEMGPTVYPEIEALKAQTIAARTYAVANLGQFVEEGFDLCDTPRCQVYGGADSEHPLTDRAIRETHGQVMLHDDEPVNAMFTSTCGGHTENVENVFSEQAEPYLRGVRCAPEAGAAGEIVAHVPGSSRLAGWPAGRGLARAAARLMVLGLIDSETLEAAPASTLVPDRWEAWQQRAATLLGKNAPAPGGKREQHGVTRGGMAKNLVALLGWAERLDKLMRPEDAAVLLGLDPTRPLPGPVRRDGGLELALLVRDGILDPDPQVVSRPWNRPVTVAEAVWALWRLVERYGVPVVEEVRVAGLVDGRLATDEGRWELAPEVFLLEAVGLGGGSEPAPVALLPVTRDEPMLLHRNASGRVDYVEGQRPFRALTDDRFSRLITWEVRRTADDLSRRLSRSLAVGDVRDFQVISRGVSGRVVELDVIGSRSTARLRGFRIRTALDLQETLFTIDRQQDAQGRNIAFNFAGKGWGHGVGLCQVGSYGMAVRGRAYQEILTHYYTGVEIVPLSEHPALLDTP